MEAKRQAKNGSNNISYTLFLYREELRRRNARIMRLSRAKVTLTDKLISTNVRQIHECSVEDLKAINREMLFRKQLKLQISRMRQLLELGHSQQQQQQQQQQYGMRRSGTYV